MPKEDDVIQNIAEADAEWAGDTGYALPTLRVGNKVEYLSKDAETGKLQAYRITCVEIPVDEIRDELIEYYGTQLKGTELAEDIVRLKERNYG